MSQSEVAKEMGLSRARVGQIEQSALRKLRRLLAEHQ
jgi:DNA-directed RNA polymerase sigma subunit (sigma70/sigma32)